MYKVVTYKTPSSTRSSLLIEAKRTGYYRRLAVKPVVVGLRSCAVLLEYDEEKFAGALR